MLSELEIYFSIGFLAGAFAVLIVQYMRDLSGSSSLNLTISMIQNDTSSLLLKISLTILLSIGVSWIGSNHTDYSSLQIFGTIGAMGTLVSVVYQYHLERVRYEKAINIAKRELRAKQKEPSPELQRENTPTRDYQGRDTIEQEQETTSVELESNFSKDEFKIKMQHLLEHIKKQLDSQQIDLLENIYENNRIVIHSLSEEHAESISGEFGTPTHMLAEITGIAIEHYLDEFDKKVGILMENDTERSLARSYLGAKGLQEI